MAGAMTDAIQYAHLGRGAAWQAYMDALHVGHTIRIRVYVLDATESAARAWDISEHITAGQVNVDMTMDPSRTLSITILDPRHRIAVTDPASSAYGGLWAGSIIQVWYDVYVPSIDTWVECPVFTGPVQRLDRQEAEVNLQAVGKEVYLLPPSSYNNIFSKARVNQLSHSRKHALSALLDAIGEPRSVDWQGDIGSISRHFDPVKSFHKGGDSYLKLVQRICGGHHQFSYDGAGRPRVRPSHHGAVMDLKGLELTEASESFDMGEVRNRARERVQKKPQHRNGTPPAPIAFVIVRPGHDPLSAQSLKRNGVPRFLDADKPSGDFKSAAAAVAAGKKKLTGYSEDVALDIVPVPFLEPGDTVEVLRHGPDGGKVRFRVRRFSLPLHVGDSMSLGYTRKLLDPKHALARHQRTKRKHAKQAVREKKRALANG